MADDPVQRSPSMSLSGLRYVDESRDGEDVPISRGAVRVALQMLDQVQGLWPYRMQSVVAEVAVAQLQQALTAPAIRVGGDRD